jgi:hypothetical protein
MRRKQLSKAELAYCHKTLSSDTLAALVLNALALGESLSVVRFSDGELAVLEHEQPARTSACLRDPGWRTKYGMEGADIKKITADLQFAAQHATYVAPSISGLYMPWFNLYPFMADRPWFVDAFYMYYWKVADRVPDIVKAANSVHIINRNWAALATAMRGKFGLVHTKVTGFALNSWQDVDAARDSALQAHAELVLVSGGPPGKRLPVDITAAYKCVALDVGCGLEVCI